jgi:hypothetical protein
VDFVEDYTPFVAKKLGLVNFFIATFLTSEQAESGHQHPECNKLSSLCVCV